MTFDSQSAFTTILPPRRATTLPSNTPADVREVANRQGGSANEIIQSAIAQSGGAVIPLSNFTTAPAPMQSGGYGSQTGTIAVVDDSASDSVHAPGDVIPFDSLVRRRLMGVREQEHQPNEAMRAGPEDVMPFVDDGRMAAAPATSSSAKWGWILAGVAAVALAWKFSQDSALQGAPLVADLDLEDDAETGEQNEPEGSEE
jgi:hypothetical protein